MSRRFSSLMAPVAAMFVVAGCAGPPMISREDVTALCTATGDAMSAVDEAMLEAPDGQGEWTRAIEAVGVVVDEARETGYPGTVELAEDWQASVVAASQADDRRAAFSLLIESEGNYGLLFMCDLAGASVPGVEPVAMDDVPDGLPGWAGAAAWTALGVAAAAAVAVRRRRPASGLLRGSLRGLLIGAGIVLVVTSVVGGWWLADAAFFGLVRSPLDGVLFVLADPATPVWALLLGGTVGSICGAAIHLLRERSRQSTPA